jgi:recombination protein U
MANPGKRFEEDFFKSSLNHEHCVDINRLRDPVGGQAGIRNICDYIVYKYPFIYYFELKSRQGNTLNFKEITTVQYEGLKSKANRLGRIPGVIVNYSDYNEAYFVHINDIVELKEKQGKKSLHINDARKLGIRLKGERKRTRFTYYIIEFLKELEERERKGWKKESGRDNAFPEDAS